MQGRNVDMIKARENLSILNTRSLVVTNITGQKRKNEDCGENDKNHKVLKSSSNPNPRRVAVSKAKELLISQGILVKQVQDRQKVPKKENAFGFPIQ